MSLVKGLQGLTAGALDGVGDTLDVVGEDLNMAADKIEGGDASAPANETAGTGTAAPTGRLRPNQVSEEPPAYHDLASLASPCRERTSIANCVNFSIAIEDSIRVNLVNHRDPAHGGFYMKLSRRVRNGDNLSALRKMIAGSVSHNIPLFHRNPALSLYPGFKIGTDPEAYRRSERTCE